MEADYITNPQPKEAEEIVPECYFIDAVRRASCRHRPRVRVTKDRLKYVKSEISPSDGPRGFEYESCGTYRW
jgi:hypothetical protein